MVHCVVISVALIYRFTCKKRFAITVLHYIECNYTTKDIEPGIY